MTTLEPECVALKRRGAVYVAKLLAGKNRQEELKFWEQRTQALRARQTSSKNRSEKGVVREKTVGQS